MVKPNVMNMQLLEDRYVEVSESGCWVWTGYTVPDGYGMISIGGRKIVAHRLSWMLHNGEIPTGICVLHKCDVPACVNPDHLFLGTKDDNMADKVKKGRQNKGENVVTGVLVEAQVRAIFASPLGPRELGRQYGISHTGVSAIKRGKAWKHLNLTT